MTWIQKTLATLGLVAAMSGCAQGNIHPLYAENEVCPNLHVQEHDWHHASRRAIYLDAPSGTHFSEPEVSYFSGNLSIDGIPLGSNRVDVIVESLDRDNDGIAEFSRATIDTTFVVYGQRFSRIIHQSPPIRARIIFIDHNNSEMQNSAWIDDMHCDGQIGYDGRYDRIEEVNVSQEEFIDNIVRLQLQAIWPSRE